MEINPNRVRTHLPNNKKKKGVPARADASLLQLQIDKPAVKLRQLPTQDLHFLKKTALDQRVLIIEGVSGSGKDRFQAYLRAQITDRDVYDFSEGELLHSWKHVPIKGVLNLTVKFMGIFVDYLKEIVNREKNAVFVLNRFHLSTYASISTRHPELLREYDEIINVLRTLPVYVFILQLDVNEIEERSSHSERSGVWPKLQRQMIANDGFRSRVEKYISQQSLMVEAATRQRIPYSIVKFPYQSEIGLERISVAKVRNIIGRGVRENATDPKISQRKRILAETL